ncbi:MAG: hypothetical protein HC834_04540 [Rhodospirillales bacterium]|nr:hypothetical protein [Rhodospirillales bacterium]
MDRSLLGDIGLVRSSERVADLGKEIGEVIALQFRLKCLECFLIKELGSIDANLTLFYLPAV